MARILLLSPPYLDIYGELRRAAGRYFPLGLAYIASYLRKFGGHEVLMYEPEAQGLDFTAIADIIRRTSPDVVGITCSTPNFTRALRLAGLCREHSRAKVVLGGVHASSLPGFIAQRHADVLDAVVVGEGEETMLELVEAFAGGRPISGVAGVAYAEGGKAVLTPPRPFIVDLDRLPPPARDLIPQGLFVPNAHNARYTQCVSMLTSRGCPFNCTFCAARLVSGVRYRMHSAEYVLEEMEALKRDYGARQIIITDDTFTVNRGRLTAICEGMIRRRLGLAWFCFSQVSAVDRETLALMKRAGCYNIGFGVESSDPKVLKRMGKNITPQAALDAVHAANAVGLKTQAFYIFGSPGETLEQMKDTVDFAGRVNATLAFFNMLVPYPGTRDFEHFFAGVPLEDIDWEDFVAIGRRCVLQKNATVSPEEIERMVTRANVRYYTNPVRIINILRHIRTPYELINYMRGGLSMLEHLFKGPS